MKKLIKWLLAMGVYYSGGLLLYRRFVKPRLVKNDLVVLRYHRIFDKPKRDPINISVSKDNFEKQMRYLKERFDIVSIPDAVERLSRHEAFARPTAAITFDDGYRNNYVYGLPTLKRYSIPATIFLTVDYIDSHKILPWDKAVFTSEDVFETSMLKWSDIYHMKDHGISFGSHTLTHPKLDEVDEVSAKKEISESAKILNERLGKDIDIFSYPHGNYNNRIKDMVREAGYKAAFVTEDGRYTKNEDLFALKRKAIHEELVTNPFGAFSKSVFAVEVEGVFDVLFGRGVECSKIENREWKIDVCSFDCPGIQERWARLQERSAEKDNIFLSFDWMRTWWNVYGAGNKPTIICIEKEGELIGIAPLYTRTKKFLFWTIKELKAIGDNDVCSDHIGIILDMRYADEAALHIYEYLRNNKNLWDIAVFDGIGENSDKFFSLFKRNSFISKRKISTHCPYITLPGSYDKYLGSLSEKRSRYFRRNMRILAERHGGRFLTYREMNSVDEALSHLERLHSMRWGERDYRGGTFSNDKIIQFHKKICEDLAGKDMLVLNFLEADGRIVAALYGFRRGDVYSFYQSGFDGDWKKFSAGSLIIAESIRHAIETGCKEFDFLRGNSEYKSIWTDKVRHEYRVELYRKNAVNLICRGCMTVAKAVKKICKIILPERIWNWAKRKVVNRRLTGAVESVKKTRIMYLIADMGLGGAQRHLTDLITVLDKDRFDPKLLTLEELGVKRIYGVSGIRGFFKLVRLMKREKYDIVHTYLFSANILGVVAAKIAGVPTIVTSRRDTGMLREGKFQHILAYRIINRFVDKIICVSNAVKRVVLEKERVDPAKVEVIYNGVEMSALENGKWKMENGKNIHSLSSILHIRTSLGIQPTDLVVGMIANFSWIKGHEDFIETARIVAGEVPNVRFVLVGEGPLKHDIQALVHKCMSSGVHKFDGEKFLFLGKRQDISELLSIMDVSINASYSEGMSNAILESMAAGLPVVATAVDGNIETVDDGSTGFLVPPRNPGAMADAIVRILKDEELRRRLRENGRLKIENRFRVDQMVRNYENLYARSSSPKLAFIMSQFPETHETFILRELRALEDRGIDFKIFSLKPCRDKVIHPEARELMKRTIYVRIHFPSCILYFLKHPFLSVASLFYALRTYWRTPKELAKALYVYLECLGFANRLKKTRTSHIHCHWATMPTTAGTILNKLTGIPFSFTAHAWDIFVSQVGLVAKIRQAKFVVTCTEYNRQYLCELVNSAQKMENRKWKIEKNPSIYRNYHGLDLDAFQYPSSIIHSPSSSKLRMLAIGRLVEQKGFEYLIKACAVLKHHGVDFELNIVGDGPLRKELEFLVVSCLLLDKVKLVGMKTQDEIRKLMSEASIFVAPSVIARGGDRDGIPNVILEAMALGVPVIATDVSGIPEVIIDNETGLLVPERDPFTLAEAIEYVRDNSASMREMIENGRSKIEDRFDTGKNISELLEIFQKNGVLLSDPTTQRPNRPINVLYIIWSLATGGAERVVVDMAKGIDRSKFNPIVCCLNGKGDLAPELEKEGIEVIALNKKGRFDFSIIHSLSSIIKRYNITIVHTHLWGANFWGRLAAKRAGVSKVIVHEHGIEVYRNKFHSFLDKHLYKKTDKVIFVSEASKRLFLSKVKTDPAKCKVIYNGVDINRFSAGVHKCISAEVRKSLGLGVDDFVIATVGRLVPNKGHEHLFEAVKLISQIRHDVRLLVAGDGPRMEELKKYRDTLGLNDTIRLLGSRDDIQKILSASDVFVLASSKEALPLSVLEAMSCARATVVTDVGGNRELVIHEETGLVVPPENARALADAVMKLMYDPALAMRMSVAARKRTEKMFSMEKWIETIESLYEEECNHIR